jgi:hypothetical protein
VNLGDLRKGILRVSLTRPPRTTLRSGCGYLRMYELIGAPVQLELGESGGVYEKGSCFPGNPMFPTLGTSPRKCPSSGTLFARVVESAAQWRSLRSRSREFIFES